METQLNAGGVDCLRGRNRRVRIDNLLVVDHVGLVRAVGRVAVLARDFLLFQLLRELFLLAYHDDDDEDDCQEEHGEDG